MNSRPRDISLRERPPFELDEFLAFGNDVHVNWFFLMWCDGVCVYVDCAEDTRM